LLVVHNCLFHILDAILQIWRPPHPSANWGCMMLWWQGSHLTRILSHTNIVLA
jgi:hypothetical protein